MGENTATQDMWRGLSEAYAFLGNSLLAPMSQTAKAGLDPDFWRAFPDFGDVGVADALDACVQFAEGALRRAQEGADSAQDVSVEYTRLFVGPPHSAASPWETMHRGKTDVGFGEATREMRALLREAGLELRNENHQYEDHMGIELLYLSELCRRRAQDARRGDDAGAAEDACASDAAMLTFIDGHPLAWVDSLRSDVAGAYPDGYFVGLLDAAAALLTFHRSILSA